MKCIYILPKEIEECVSYVVWKRELQVEVKRRTDTNDIGLLDCVSTASYSGKTSNNKVHIQSSQPTYIQLVTTSDIRIVPFHTYLKTKKTTLVNCKHELPYIFSVLQAMYSIKIMLKLNDDFALSNVLHVVVTLNFLISFRGCSMYS